MTRAAGVARHGALAALCYVPLLLTAPGRVAADTKTYLTLDPGRLLAGAPFMWDPGIGLGTVTHQNIGYLFPMGPWFWFFDRLGAPDWVAQRLWLGTIMFAAGAGVLFLLRTLGWPDHRSLSRPDEAAGAAWHAGGAMAAAAVYVLSPYVLHYAARISVLLLPWAALPWLIGLAQRAIRGGGWRHPAVFALVVTAVGGVNATALVLAGLGPLLWFPFAVWVHREVSLRVALAAAGRIGLLTAACSLWWIAGLAAQGGYGIDILRFTETVPTVARTSLSSEVLRGLGYWFFYGGDLLGPWIEPARSYTQALWLIAVGFAVPLIALAAGFSIRWRYRAYFATLVVLGTVVAVGAYPYDDPSPAGAAFIAFAETSSAGLALRSTPRVVPLVVLGLAVLIGGGLAALWARVPRLSSVASVVVIALAVAGLPALWTGEVIGENLHRPEKLPAHWREAATWIDARGHDTRVLELPGSDFAAYRWGNTVDPVTPGLIDRPYVARELIPYGSPPSADLLIAVDRRIQEGVLDPAALAPVARLLGVGDIVVRSDLQFERYRGPRPRAVWELLTPPPDGLAPPVGFGPGSPNEPERDVPLVDAITLAIDPATPHPPEVAAFAVRDPVPIVRARPAAVVLLAGSGEGVVEAAAAGVLGGDRTVLYAGDLAGDAALWQRALDHGPHLVLTDSNRRQARRWNTVRENAGMTERGGQQPLVRDPSDNRLPVFPDAGEDAFTVVEQRGVQRVDATAYGNTITYTAEDRPAHGFDGRLDTAWRVGGFGGVRGERIELEVDDAVVTDRITVVQPLHGHRNRFITQVEVRLDGDPAGTFDLGPESRTPQGQDLVFGSRRFHRLDVVITEDNIGPRPDYAGLSPVGFAQVQVAGVRVDEVVRLPRDLLARAERSGQAGTAPLTVVLARQRANPLDDVRADEEPAMARAFTLPAARRVTLSGQARLAAGAPDALLAATLGARGVRASASSRLTGHPASWAGAALDGDPGTAWRAAFGEQAGQWIEIDAGEQLSFGHIDLTLVVDGRHSVPSRIGIELDGARVASVEVPAVVERPEEGATTTVRLEVGPVTGRAIRLVVDDVRAALGSNSFSVAPQVLPLAVAEVSIPGLAAASPPATLPAPCRDDLLTIAGRPVHVRVLGSGTDALDRTGLTVEACGPDAAGIDLPAGDHDVRAAPGVETGFDLDRLVLASPAPASALATPSPPSAPTVEVTGSGRTSLDLIVRDIDGPFWLVLGQSHNRGWVARAEGPGDLGTPVIADGFANGWYVDPAGRGELTIALRWAPQRMVWLALALSALAVALCLALALPATAEIGGETGVEPVLWSPLGPLAAPPPVRVVIAAAAALGLAAALIARPGIGVLVGVATTVALVVPRGRAVLAAGSLGALGLAAAYVVLKQARHGFPPDFGWPASFHRAHILAWMAIALLGVDAVVSRLRRPTRRLGAKMCLTDTKTHPNVGLSDVREQEEHADPHDDDRL